ncbi:hypothetical protein DL769_010309 [Monosporascus sp. CRB-8-3]|nr:hypothetical protein DL769_010309 [Monosporascus sp. CRB-8-3]
MICKQLTRPASLAWLLSCGALGGRGGPDHNPLSGLARHGIKWPLLDEVRRRQRSNRHHAPWRRRGGGLRGGAGASSSAVGGVTVDLHRVDRVASSPDRGAVSIALGTPGAGSTGPSSWRTRPSSGAGWRRSPSGDCCWAMANQRGWACDNAANYEVVLASGEIVDANAHSYADLFWALRGGGGNFGIVTRFDVSAFEQGGTTWGGSVQAGPGEQGGGDRRPDRADNAWETTIILDYADPQPEGARPAAFGDSFLGGGAVYDSLANSSLANLTEDLGVSSPFGYRYTYWTLTTRLELRLLADMAPLRNVASVLPSMPWQIITRAQREAMERNGGDALGISGGREPLLLMNISVQRALASDDEAVLSACRNVIRRSEALARERELHHPYLCTLPWGPQGVDKCLVFKYSAYYEALDL